MLDKMLSNMAEVQARGAHVIAVATEGSHAGGGELRGGASTCRAPTGCSSRCWPWSRCSCFLLRGARARAEHRPAAQPREDRHGRVDRALSGVGLDLLDIARLERALERRPRLAERLFTEAEREYAAERARPGAAPRRPLLRQGGGGQGAGPARLELPRRGGRGRRTARPSARLSGAAAAAGRGARRAAADLADPHRDAPPARWRWRLSEPARLARPAVRGRGDARGGRLGDRGARRARRWT